MKGSLYFKKFVEIYQRLATKTWRLSLVEKSARWCHVRQSVRVPWTYSVMAMHVTDRTPGTLAMVMSGQALQDVCLILTAGSYERWTQRTRLHGPIWSPQWGSQLVGLLMTGLMCFLLVHPLWEKVDLATRPGWRQSPINIRWRDSFYNSGLQPLTISYDPTTCLHVWNNGYSFLVECEDSADKLVRARAVVSSGVKAASCQHRPHRTAPRSLGSSGMGLIGLTSFFFVKYT